MRTRDLFIICPLLAIAVLCYFVGTGVGKREQLKSDIQFNIRRTLRTLQYAETGQYSNIVRHSRMYLFGHTTTYNDLVSQSDVPDSFKEDLAEAQRIANIMRTNLVVVDRKTLKKALGE